MKEKRELREMNRKIKLFAFGGLLVAIAILRIYQLDVLPLSMHIDEAGLGLNAWSLAHYGTDRYGNVFPACPINFYGEQSAFYTYFCAALVKLFGLNIYTLRMPGVIMGILSVMFGALIFKERWGEKGMFLGALLMGIFPYFIMNSRFALDCNAMLGMLTIALYAFIKLMQRAEAETEKGFYGRFAFTGILFGLVLYTYIIAAIVIAVFCVFFGLYYLFYRKENRCHRFKQLFFFAMPLCVMLIPLLLVVCVNYFGWEPIELSFFSIPKMPVNRTEEVAFSIKTLPGKIKALLHTLTTDGKYGSSERYWTMYPISVPFVLAGGLMCIAESIKALKKRRLTIDACMLALTIAECLMFILCGLYNYHVNGIFIALAYFCVRGLLGTTACIRNTQVKYVFTAAVFIAYAAAFTGFSAEYYGTQETGAYQVYGGIEEALGLLTSEQQERDIYIMDDVGEFYFLTNPISPEEFVRGCDDLGYMKIYQNLHFYEPETLLEDAVYICTKISGRYAYFCDSSVAGNSFAAKETEHYYLFYTPGNE